MIDWPPKAPAEVEDFAFEWAASLADGETIVSKDVVPSGVTIDSESIAGTQVRVWLSGGVEGMVARVTCTITTSGGRTFSEVAVLPIGGQPVSLARAKQHLRVQHDRDDDLIAALLGGAVDHIETMTGKCLTAKIVEQKLRAFPGTATGEVRIFKGPVREVVAVEYDDAAGVATELLDYRLVEGIDGVLMPAVGEGWPVALSGAGSVRLRLLCGYDPGEMPKALETAVLMMTAHLYQNREAVSAGTSVETPLGVKALIGPHCSVGIA